MGILTNQHFDYQQGSDRWFQPPWKTARAGVKGGDMFASKKELRLQVPQVDGDGK
jgi:hypothetical protein